ncbi:MAG: hypothetical protein ACYDDF_02785 [Thermoplasmatota archaeon]
MRLGWLVLGVVMMAGCTVGLPHMAIAVSAPLQAGGLTIFIATSGLPDGQAAFSIETGGTQVYPPGDVTGAIPVSGSQGALFVPYNAFVTGNGLYNVTVAFGGQTQTYSADVEKWVNYVYLHPFPEPNDIQVDAQLSKAEGGTPDERILADGALSLDILYHGISGSQPPTENGGSVTVQTSTDDSFTRTDIPMSTFTQGPGWYSIEGRFDNNQAFDNTGVGDDPTMAEQSPPWNWVCINTCAGSP